MLRTLWTSKSGLAANQDRLDCISNNIANSSTMGYKKLNVGFKDLLNESLDRKGYPINDTKASMGTGVKTTDWYRSSKQGNLYATELTTDLCIEGENNYFRLTSPSGEKLYTRDGAFQVDSYGRLVDTSGNILDIEYVDEYAETGFKIDTKNLIISEEGYVFNSENGINTLVGKINIYTAVGDQAFVSVGENLFIPADTANVQVSNSGRICQGYLEGSNVDIAQEFTDMIVTQRAFQLCSKSLQTADDMWGMVNNIR